MTAEKRMTAEKWGAFPRRQPGQTSLVVATFDASRTMASHRKPAHVGT